LNQTAEFIFVLEGGMDITILSQTGELVEKVELKSKTALLQFRGGHEIFLKPKTKYFELKQGPYFGQASDKKLV
jgi:hypothetical protein